MSPEEKSDNTAVLKDDGNKLFKARDFENARIKYGTALELLDQLCLREKPGEPEWVELENRKVPFLLNISQCEIQLERYYEAINHAADAISKDPNCVKAYFRRAKAHMAVWNLAEARSDFNKVTELDKSLGRLIEKELAGLRLKQLEKLEDEKNLFKNKLLK